MLGSLLLLVWIVRLVGRENLSIFESVYSITQFKLVSFEHTHLFFRSPE